MRRGKNKGISRAVSAVMTVEASFVTAAMLFSCGAVLTEGFRIHSRTAGMMILMDAAENVRNDGVKEAEQWANQALQAYYRCAEWSIGIEEKGKRLTGKLYNSQGREEGEIEIEVFEPERFLRLVRAFGE